MNVLTCAEAGHEHLARLLEPFGLEPVVVEDGAPIPGSFWGDDEAGLIGRHLYLRDSTPVHSALHEACHYICMDAGRRSVLDTDAGGDDAEENAVCYLQILLSDHLPGVGRERLFADMDSWGYSFRLGSARDWFERDAEDARRWLIDRKLIDEHALPAWTVRR